MAAFPLLTLEIVNELAKSRNIYFVVKTDNRSYQSIDFIFAQILMKKTIRIRKERGRMIYRLLEPNNCPRIWYSSQRMKGIIMPMNTRTLSQ